MDSFTKVTSSTSPVSVSGLSRTKLERVRWVRNGEAYKDVQINVKFARAERERLNRAAEMLGCTQADVLRMALNNLFELGPEPDREKMRAIRDTLVKEWHPSDEWERK